MSQEQQSTGAVSEPKSVSKSSHRIIDVEVEEKHEQASDQPDEPFQSKPSLMTRFRIGIVRFFQKLSWVFLIAVVALLGYLSWANNQDDWQIEHINTLQTQVVQLKSDIKKLKVAQNQLSTQLEQNASSQDSKQVENIALLETKLETLQQSVSKLESVPSGEVTAAEPANTQALTNLTKQVADLKHQLVTLSQQQEARSQSAKETSSSSPSLSAKQIQHWAMQINTDWMLVGDKEQTLNSLSALKHAVDQSDLTEKSQLLTNIALDQQALQAMAEPTSIANAASTIVSLRHWIQNWQPALKPLKPSTIVSHETPPVDSEETAWQKLQQKFLSLFSVRKRTDDASMTQVEQIAEQEVIKQRFLLLLDRLDWALMSKSSSQLDASRQMLMTFVKQEFSSYRSALSPLLKPIQQTTFEQRQPLKVVGG